MYEPVLIFSAQPIVELCSELLEFLTSELQPPAAHQKKKHLSAAQADYQNCLQTASVARDFFRLLVPLLQPTLGLEGGFPGFARAGPAATSMGSSSAGAAPLQAISLRQSGRRQQLLEQLVANPLMGKLSGCLRQHIVLTSRFEELQQQAQAHTASASGASGGGLGSPSKTPHSPRADLMLSSGSATVAPLVYVGPDGHTTLKSGPVVTLSSSGGFAGHLCRSCR